MKSQNTKSSDELHREVKQEIRNVERDLNQIQGRLSPGQLIDDAIFYPHGRNMSSTLDHMKRNPVGTAFLSLGTLMLMEDDTHTSMEANARIKLGEARSKLGDLKQQVKNQMPHKELSPGTAPNMADIAKGKVTEMKGKMMDVKSSVQSKVSDIKDSVQTKISDVRSSVSQAQENLSERVTDMKADVTDRVSEFQSASENEGTNWKANLQSSLQSGKERMQNIDPLTYMALGAGLGALTGASLPVSDKEQAFVDDKLRDRISSFSEDLQNAINDCAGILKDLVVQDVKDYSFKIF